QGKLPFWPIYLAAVAGAVVGDAVSYWIGHLFKDSIKSVWPFRNYLPLIGRLESMGLSLEMVLIVGALVLLVAVIVLHYWKRIVLLFTPFLGEFGRSLEARWRKPKVDETPTTGG